MSSNSPSTPSSCDSARPVCADVPSTSQAPNFEQTKITSSNSRVSPATARSVPSSNEATSPSETAAASRDFVYFTSELANQAMTDLEKEKERFDSLLSWHISYRRNLEAQKSSSTTQFDEPSSKAEESKTNGVKRKRAAEDDEQSDASNSAPKKMAVDENPETETDKTAEKGSVEKSSNPEESVLWKLANTNDDYAGKDTPMQKPSPNFDETNPLRKMEMMTNATSFKQPPNLNEMAEMQAAASRKEKSLENPINGKISEQPQQAALPTMSMQAMKPPSGQLPPGAFVSGQPSPGLQAMPMPHPQFAQNSPSYPPVGLNPQPQGANPFHMHPQMRGYLPNLPHSGPFSAGSYPQLQPPNMSMSAGYPMAFQYPPNHPGYPPMPHPAARQGMMPKTASLKPHLMAPHQMYMPGHPAMMNAEQKGASSPKMSPAMIPPQMIPPNCNPMHITPPFYPNADQFGKPAVGMPYPPQAYSGFPGSWPTRMPAGNNPPCMLMVRQETSTPFSEPQMNGWPSALTPNYPPAFANSSTTANATPNKQIMTA